MFELLAGLVARSLVVAEEHGPRPATGCWRRSASTASNASSQAGETERWRARHASYYADLLGRVRDHAHDPDQEVFWAVRLSAEQDNLLAAWSWAIGTGNVGTAFQILAGFAPGEVWITYPLLLPGEAALELPGASRAPGLPARPGGQRRVRVHPRGCDRRRGTVPPGGRSQRAPGHPGLAGRGDHLRRPPNIATTRGAFADAARLAEQAAGIARAGGDLADASVELTIAVADHLLVGDAPAAVPLAREALALARQIGAPALIASALLAVGAAVAETDPGQARACLRESRELSTALGYQSARDLVWATGIAFLVGDQAAALELGRSAIRGLQWGGDRIRMGIVLYIIAGTLATTRPEAAAIIQGAAEAYVVESPRTAQLISSTLTEALGEERARELRARGADMDWDQALAYTLTQTTHALSELQSETQP